MQASKAHPLSSLATLTFDPLHQKLWQMSRVYKYQIWRQ